MSIFNCLLLRRKFQCFYRHLSCVFSSSAAESGVPHKSIRNQDVTSPTSVPPSSDVVIIGKYMFHLKESENF